MLRLTTALLVTCLSGTVAAQQPLYGIGNGNGDGSSNLYLITNYNTGAPAVIDLGDLGVVMTDIGVNPVTGRIYAVDFVTFYEVFPTNPPSATPIGAPGALLNVMEFDNSGRCYAMASGFTDLYEVDLETGEAALIGDTGFSSTGGLAIDVDGKLYQFANNGFGVPDDLICHDLATGVSTILGSPGLDQMYGLEIDRDGEVYACHDTYGGDIQIIRLDKSSGMIVASIAIQGSAAQGCWGLAFNFSRGFHRFGDVPPRRWTSSGTSARRPTNSPGRST